MDLLYSPRIPSWGRVVAGAKECSCNYLAKGSAENNCGKALESLNLQMTCSKNLQAYLLLETIV